LSLIPLLYPFWVTNHKNNNITFAFLIICFTFAVITSFIPNYFPKPALKGWSQKHNTMNKPIFSHPTGIGLSRSIHLHHRYRYRSLN